ncbi:mpv17-like protein [Seriola lalandi dorsalis]|uniref:Si:ch211-120k19.1 n=1 Tax=Seriola lalandi dorsalis TaxID=1841481 RepID=A0A3B4Y6S2_SERLL|nr:mpv17-like protein [Seriola lalandi dorsalis]XP_023258114.1 mpv17-like protein [Seriola lalandi dorsalis]XP_023258116.1 mpv17-like protein [Seriola lalandi dorsalis]XP_056237432.1 mpv17-like protein [Seriola aureovittata]
MNRAWAVFKAHPYISNVVGYTTLFASADVIQQSVLGGKHAAGATSDGSAGIDWCQTARVATVGFCFHANFNYHWLRWLERMLPGGGVKAVTGKVVVDQLVAAPLTISAFYIGLSLLEKKEDPLEDWRQKFWTSYKAGVVFWSTMQGVNFALVPPVARTVFLGGIALTFTVFLCHLRQQRGHKLE